MEICIITDWFFDETKKRIVPRGASIQMEEIIKFINKNYKIKFVVYQKGSKNLQIKRKNYRVNIIKSDNFQDFLQKIENIDMPFVHFNNVDLTYKTDKIQTATIHTNAFLSRKDKVEKFLEIYNQVFVVNNEYISQYKEKPNLTLIKNGINTSFFKFKSKKIGKNINLFFPNLPLENKNPLFAVQLLNELNSCQNNYKFKLYICGFENFNNKNVIPLGILSRKKMVKYYQKCHFSLIPSLAESCSLALLESNACGCLPVVNKIVGMQEYIDDKKTGLTISIDNPEIWVSSILDLTKNSLEYFKILRNGRSNVEEKYNLAHTANEYYTVWRKLIK